MHFRPPRTTISQYKFHYGDLDVNITDKYKYLGVMLDDKLKYDVCSKLLSESAGRALGNVISKFKEIFKHYLML